MLMATTMELITAKIMIRLFGAFWWDYSKKRCIIKGSSALRAAWDGGFRYYLLPDPECPGAEYGCENTFPCGGNMWPWRCCFSMYLTSSTASGWNFVKKNCEDNREITRQDEDKLTGELTDYKIRYGLGRRTEDSGVRPFHCPRPCVQRGFMV